MKLYFSGIAGEAEYRMLKSAGVNHLLVDQFDLDYVPKDRGHLALDSGAYKVFKRNLKRKHEIKLDLESYLAVVRSRKTFDFAVALDVIGDAEATRENWERLRRLRSRSDPPFIPVFQWGSPDDELKRYLDEAPVVGIGGLVNLMRGKNRQMLEQLGELCIRHPSRFHLFGINWLSALNQLHPLIASGDTSKFLDGKRYRMLIFMHSRSKKLVQVHAGRLKIDPDPTQLCVDSARNLEAYLSGGISTLS